MSAKATSDDGSTETETNDEQNSGTGRVHDWGVNENITRTLTEASEADDRPGLVWNKKNSHGDEVAYGLTAEWESAEAVHGDLDDAGKYTGVFTPANEESAEATDGEVEAPELVVTTDTRETARRSMIEFLRDLSPEDLGYDGRADTSDDDAEEDDEESIRETVQHALDMKVRDDEGDIDYSALQSIAASTEGVKGSGMSTNEMYDAVLEAKVEEQRDD